MFIFLKTIIPSTCSESADRECIRPHASALKARGEKTHGRFPLVAPLFPYAIVPQRQNATHAITAGRKKTKRRKNARNDKNTQYAATKAAAQNAGRNARQKPAHYPKSCFYPPNGVPQLIARPLFWGVIKYQGGRVGMGAKTTPQMGSTC